MELVTAVNRNVIVLTITAPVGIPATVYAINCDFTDAEWTTHIVSNGLGAAVTVTRIEPYRCDKNSKGAMSVQKGRYDAMSASLATKIAAKK